MNLKTNYHTHTTYCDGIDSPEEVVLSAIDKAFDIIGFSGHSHTAFDESYAMTKDSVIKYRKDIRELADKYSDRINVLCGIEYDFYSDETTDGWDYIIGSVHYIRVPYKEGDRLHDDRYGYIPVDESVEDLISGAERHFGGDIYSLIEAYYDTVSRLPEITGCSIAGHVDLITKFNEKSALFDENNPRYVAAYQSAIKKLCDSSIPFEINSNAVCKGYRTSPYPSRQVLETIRNNGGKILYSSDCHNCRKLDFYFEEMKALAYEAGFRSRVIITADGTSDVSL